MVATAGAKIMSRPARVDVTGHTNPLAKARPASGGRAPGILGVGFNGEQALRRRRVSESSGPSGWNQKIIDEFRSNAGKAAGYFDGAPMILIHHIGARSGTNGSIRWSTCRMPET